MSERIQPETASTYADSTRTSRLSSAPSDATSTASPVYSHANETCAVRGVQPVLVPGPNITPGATTTTAAADAAAPVAPTLPTTVKGPPPPVPPHRHTTGRARAPSDPFLDDNAASGHPHRDDNNTTDNDDEVPVAGLGPRVRTVPHAAAPATRTVATLTLPSPVPRPLSPLGVGSDLPWPTASTPFLLPTPYTAASSLGPHDSSVRLPSSHAPVSPRVLRPPPPPLPPPGATVAALPARPRPPPAAAVPPQARVFTLPPYLTNTELLALLRLFPSFIAAPVRRAAAAAAAGTRHRDLEELTTDLEERLGAVVHGQIMLATDHDAGEGWTTTMGTTRSPGWRGTWWERFVLWVRRWFGLA